MAKISVSRVIVFSISHYFPAPYSAEPLLFLVSCIFSFSTSLSAESILSVGGSCDLFFWRKVTYLPGSWRVWVKGIVSRESNYSQMKTDTSATSWRVLATFMNYILVKSQSKRLQTYVAICKPPSRFLVICCCGCWHLGCPFDAL